MACIIEIAGSAGKGTASPTGKEGAALVGNNVTVALARAASIRLWAGSPSQV